MSEEGLQSQPKRLAATFAHLLEIIDESLGYEGIPLPERPFRASIDLLREGFVTTSIPDLDVRNWPDYSAEPWFRAIFTGVEEWYRDHYGAPAIKARGNPPLEGAVLIREAPFALRVPMHRSKIEIEGKTAWMYFEAGIGEGETPQDWVVAGPNFERLNERQRAGADQCLHFVASSLRAVQHHLLGVTDSEIQTGLRAAVRSYLEAAARRILAQTASEFTLAWMDLQTASESALKLVIARQSGSHPHEHELSELLTLSGVDFDPARLAGWPRFKRISNRRYGRDYMDGLAELYAAYLLTLDLVSTTVRTIEAPLPSGAGLLLHVAPYLIDDPLIGKS